MKKEPVFYDEHEFDKALSEFEPPFVKGGGKVPYVLFWRPRTLISGNDEITKWELSPIRPIGSVGTEQGISYYIKKPGWKLIRYDFLGLEDSKYQEIQSHLDMILANTSEKVNALQQELIQERNERKVLEAKINEQKLKIKANEQKN